MSITGGTLHSVLTSYSSYSTQSSSKHSSTEIANSSSSTTGDIVSLSAQSLSRNIETDSGSTTVELSAQSVSVTVSSSLGDYDLTNMTPHEVYNMANTLWQNGIISIEEMVTLYAVGLKHEFPYAPGVQGPSVNEPFNLIDELNKVATGTHEQLSVPDTMWPMFDSAVTATSLLDIFKDLDDTTIEIATEYVRATIENTDGDLENFTSFETYNIANSLWQKNVISSPEMILLQEIGLEQQGYNETEKAADIPFNLLQKLGKIASGNSEGSSFLLSSKGNANVSEVANALLEKLSSL